MKDLSIIITHYKTPELLTLCIDSIKKNLKGLDYEIIVVDSEREKKNQDFITEKYSDVQYLGFDKNVGYAKIVNAGIRKAQGEYLLILNADIILLEWAVEKMLEYLKNHEKVGIVTPQLLDFTNKMQASCFRDPDWKIILARRTFLGKLKWGKSQLKRFILLPTEDNAPQKVDWSQGSAMLVRREAVNKIGLLDERFFMYFEDADWCRRFRAAGYDIVYLPEAKMYHYYHRASKKWGFLLDLIFNKYTRIHIISSIKYFLKWRNYDKK